jgi:hypothetical protein
MKNYGLYTKLKNNSVNELVYTLRAETLEEAIILFAKRKKLPKKDLLEIFEVKEA